VREAVDQRIAELDPAQWNALTDGANPFVRHAWLAALESTRCVGAGSGWHPATITLSDARGLAAAAPAYLKQHSYGEFVFDFSWAQAYARAGLGYYPKLVVAVPFTPATGPRLLVRPDLPFDTTAARLLEAIEGYVESRGLATAHVLFPDAAAKRALDAAGWLSRRDCQFHWHNRDYADFDAFLGSFTAEKRKKAKRERRRVAEQGIHYETRTGAELSDAELDRVYALHRDTFLRHGHEPYLTREFFTAIARTPDGGLVTKLGRYAGEIVAVAIFFVGRDILYGRYWGAAADLHSLHFETCYHQGVELCLERGLAHFEPGTQGEHKVARGFEPTLTWSSHFVAEPRFRAAIGDFLRREASQVDDYATAVSAHMPYR
jgi:predicted N-acyltransferase